MVTTYTVTDKKALTPIRTWVLDFLTGFSLKHAGVFRALSRAGNPYLPSNASLISRANAGNHGAEQRIVRLQQQVNELNQTVAWLKEQTNGQPESSMISSVAYPTKVSIPLNEIGLKRFRALQASR